MNSSGNGLYFRGSATHSFSPPNLIYYSNVIFSFYNETFIVHDTKHAPAVNTDLSAPEFGELSKLFLNKNTPDLKKARI